MRSAAWITAVAAVPLVGALIGSPAAAVPDSSFTGNLGSGPNGQVLAIASQPDGKVIIGGAFTTINSVNVSDRLTRLNADGTVDTSFDTALGSGLNGNVTSLALQPDGKVLVGGKFATLNGTAVPNGLIRLNPDGTPDTAFNTALGSGFVGDVLAVTLEANDRILVGGNFTTLNGTNIPDRLVRLSAGGEVGAPFSTALGTGFNGVVNAIAVDSDESIVVGGSFTTLNGATVPRGLARLLPTGAPSTAFNTNLGTGFNNDVHAVMIRPEGSVVVGGQFTSLNGNAAAPDRLLLLTSDGSADPDFNTALGSGLNNTVLTLAMLPTKAFLVGGDFTTLNGSAVPARLISVGPGGLADKRVNDTLGTGFSDDVNALQLRPDGSVPVGGKFATADGQAPANLTVIQTPPTVVRNVTATPRDAAAQVSWTAPVSPGGGPLTYAAVASAPGRPSQLCVVAAATKCTIKGLVNGVTYSVEVTAANGPLSSDTSKAITVTPRKPITVTWTTSGRRVTATFTGVSGSLFYNLTSTGVTTKAVPCSRVGTTTPARFTCSLVLSPGKSTVRVIGFTAYGLSPSISTSRTLTVS